MEAVFAFSANPKLAYMDPSNVHICYDSPCRDAGNPLINYANQEDMDHGNRVVGYTVDMGAYEIDCEDTSNSYDINADGLVNLYEFNGLSKAWMGHDPNDPVWLADPNLRDPNLSEGWYEWKYKYNYQTFGSSQYAIDLADLLTFLEDAPWLWKACWLDLEEMQQQSMMMSMPESQSTTEFSILQSDSLKSANYEISSLKAEPVKSVDQQIYELEDAAIWLENLWLTDSNIQQEIDAKDWQRFMDSVQNSLIELKTQSVQLE